MVLLLFETGDAFFVLLQRLEVVAMLPIQELQSLLFLVDSAGLELLLYIGLGLLGLPVQLTQVPVHLVSVGKIVLPADFQLAPLPFSQSQLHLQPAQLGERLIPSLDAAADLLALELDLLILVPQAGDLLLRLLYCLLQLVLPRALQHPHPFLQLL
jgi:hypothetical protein